MKPINNNNPHADLEDDLYVAEIMEQRKHETPMRVSLDDL